MGLNNLSARSNCLIYFTKQAIHTHILYFIYLNVKKVMGRQVGRTHRKIDHQMDIAFIFWLTTQCLQEQRWAIGWDINTWTIICWILGCTLTCNWHLEQSIQSSLINGTAVIKDILTSKPNASHAYVLEFIIYIFITWYADKGIAKLEIVFAEKSIGWW